MESLTAIDNQTIPSLFDPNVGEAKIVNVSMVYATIPTSGRLKLSM
jgi:hypothetical protein